MSQHPYITSLRKRMLEQRDELDEHGSILIHMFELAVPDNDQEDPTRYWKQYAAWFAERLAEAEQHWETNAEECPQ